MSRGCQGYQINGYTVLNPEGDWSYISSNGKKRSCIDHVLSSETLQDVSARYPVELDGILMAGSSMSGAVSDHGVLEVVITGSEL